MDGPGRPVCVLAAAIHEDDATCDEHMLREIHVARQPLRNQAPYAVGLLEGIRADATARGPRVLDWRPEFAANRSIKRDEDPLPPLRILPRRHRAPDAVCVEPLHIVAEQRRDVQGGTVIRPSKRYRDRAAIPGTPCSSPRGISLPR